MPIYYNNGKNTLAVNPVPPTCLMPGDGKYMLGLSVAAGIAPTPGQVQEPNDSNVLFEAVNVNDRSIAINLAPRPMGGSTPGLLVQVSADGDPGAAEIDIQDAAVDADGAYLTPNNAVYKITAWTLNGAVYTAWTELQPESGRFVTLKVIANPNGVKFTAKAVYV
ncbi:hypothetical protein KGP36_03255 [Patescibacteria group bacterium]|nr:hypothetical protein [Patescibacteria group bacterium]